MTHSACLAVLCLEAVALSATVLEVQSRYHAFFEPILCLLAGAAVAWLAERVRKPGAASSVAMSTAAASASDLATTGDVRSGFVRVR